MLPPSVLFLGRKVYFAAIMLVSVAARQRRIVGATAEALRRMFGVSRTTLQRWLNFFLRDFPQSTAWKLLRGRVSARVRDDQLPSDLLDEFERSPTHGKAALTASLTELANAAIQAP